jgi:PKD repeat protein
VGGFPTQANSVQLAEIELIGNPVYTYSWTFGDGGTSTAQNPQHTFAASGGSTVVLVASDGTAFATNTMTVTAWPLFLAAAPSAPGAIAISWPVGASNCHLYTTTNLVPPISWSLVTNAVATNGANCTVTVPAASGNRFFQLSSP